MFLKMIEGVSFESNARSLRSNRSFCYILQRSISYIRDNSQFNAINSFQWHCQFQFQFFSFRRKQQTVIYASEFLVAINHLYKCKNWHFKPPFKWMYVLWAARPSSKISSKRDRKITTQKWRTEEMHKPVNHDDNNNNNNPKFRILSFGRMSFTNI